MPNTDVTRIAGNIGALNALNSLMYVNKQLAVHQTRLATGKRINEAADDPAGLNMALNFDIRRNDLKLSLRAIGDAKSMLSIAETGLRKIADILVKMKNKVMEAAGATIGDPEREAIAVQMNAYAKEIDDIVVSSNWNGVPLIGASSSATTTEDLAKDYFVGVDGEGQALFAAFEFGAAGSAGVTAAALGLSGAGSATNIGFYSYEMTDINASGSVQAGGYDISDLTFSGSALNTLSTDGTTWVAGTGSDTLSNITEAVDVVKRAIADVGSMGARLNFKEDALMGTYINTEAAYNRIMNADMAEEQVNASKYLILQQTATAMLSQANLAPQFLLSLFR